MVLPIEVGVVDDLVGRWGAPWRQVFCGVGIADEGRVIAPHDRSVECRPDAFVSLRSGHNQATDVALVEYGLEVGLLERVGVSLGTTGSAAR